MSKTFDQGREEIVKLCRYFADNRSAFLAPGVKEAHIRAQRTVTQRQIDSTDHEINGLVYELYGLTEEEIKIVEDGATK